MTDGIRSWHHRLKSILARRHAEAFSMARAPSIRQNVIARKRISPLFVSSMRGVVAALSVLVTLLIFSSEKGRTVSATKEKRALWRRLFPKKRQEQDSMGQVMRVMKYDRSANIANAVPSLEFLGTPLQWHRLDDGVMGGQSETVHVSTDQGLHFTGTINTDGGGFTSVRAPLPEGLPKESEAIRLRYRGDGKTYKLTLTDGKSSTGSPMSRTPSWQADLPTEKRNQDSDDWQEMTIPLSTLRPTWGGRASSRPPKEEQARYSFDATEMNQIGLMLSLYLSDGRPNPRQTFGEGIFPFSLHIKSIEPVLGVK